MDTRPALSDQDDTVLLSLVADGDTAALEVSPLFAQVLEDVAQFGQGGDFGHNIDVMVDAELNEAMYPFNREAMFYQGKQYGTPYYGDIYVYMYDQEALAEAGVESAPVTLDQLSAAALGVKKAGIAEYPIL